MKNFFVKNILTVFCPFLRIITERHCQKKNQKQKYYIIIDANALFMPQNKEKLIPKRSCLNNILVELVLLLFFKKTSVNI